QGKKPSPVLPDLKELPKANAEINRLIKGNKLRAIQAGPAGDEQDGGKLLWEVPSYGDKNDPFKGSFFLAPPLPLEGRLYVLNEKDAVVRLVCLEPRDKPKQYALPRVVWVEPLAKLIERFELTLDRRINAAHLAYADGVLVCPTNAGVIFGVDLLSHKVLWI